MLLFIQLLLNLNHLSREPLSSNPRLFSHPDQTRKALPDQGLGVTVIVKKHIYIYKLKKTLGGNCARVGVVRVGIVSMPFKPQFDDPCSNPYFFNL